jgi:hypothetical protein
VTTVGFADVYRVGTRVADVQYGPCLDTAGKSIAARAPTTACRDGQRVIWNEYGWWSSRDFIVHALVRGAPPESVVLACSAAPPSSPTSTS